MNDEALKILYVSAEMAPLLSTGGLGEVAQALPRALARQGHDVRVAMPCYRAIPEAQRGEECCMCVAELGAKTVHGAMRAANVPGTGIPLYLIEHAGYFDRPRPYDDGHREYPDNAERFCFFCKALLHAMPQTGWMPDVIHCHDWHTAPIPIFLKTQHEPDSPWYGIPVVFTIHNLAYQGRYGPEVLPYTGLDPALYGRGSLEFHGDINLMKGAIEYCGRLSTVSPRYAKEIQTVDYGAGLDGVLHTRAGHLRGIVNGVDYSVWNPETDPYLKTNYSKKDLTGKAKCKTALQQAFGLPVSSVPLFGMVTRLAWQKGVDVFVQALEPLLTMDLQIAVLGSGDPNMEAQLIEAARQHPKKLAVTLAFNPELSHQVQAGSDFLLMPSRYEPCGLSQLFSYAYGTVPIARWTGGLVDTVRGAGPVHDAKGDATGFTFVPMTPQALTRSVAMAVDAYADKKRLKQLQQNGMAEDYSWDRSCEAYVNLYREAMEDAAELAGTR